MVGPGNDGTQVLEKWGGHGGAGALSVHKAVASSSSGA